MNDKRARQTSERDTFSYSTPLLHFSFNYTIKKMISTSNECQLQLVFQAFERDLQIGIRKATRLYNVFYSILSYRINGRSIHVDTMVNLWKLTVLKEKVVVREVFDLDSRRFPLRIHNIKDMTNRLLTIYNTIYIGLHWAFNFIKR